MCAPCEINVFAQVAVIYFLDIHRIFLIPSHTFTARPDKAEVPFEKIENAVHDTLFLADRLEIGRAREVEVLSFARDNRHILALVRLLRCGDKILHRFRCVRRDAKEKLHVIVRRPLIVENPNLVKRLKNTRKFIAQKLRRERPSDGIFYAYRRFDYFHIGDAIAH